MTVERNVRRGVWVFPSAPASVLLDAILTAEDLGIDEFWIGDEGAARDPFTVLAAAAARTQRIRLGIAVTNPYLRHPVTIAAEAMTVHELAAGRFVLALGPGGHIALDPAHVTRHRPLHTTARALRTIRAVARGVASDTYTPPSAPFTRPELPVFIGSRSERFQRLASAEADGVFLAGLPSSVLPQTVAWARSVRPIEIALYGTAVFDPEEAARLPERLILPLSDSPDHVLDALDLDRADVAAARAAFVAGDPRPARRLVSEEIFAELVLAGTPVEVGRALAARARAYEPHSIGLTFVTPDPLRVVTDAAAAFAVFDRALRKSPDEDRVLESP